MRALVENISPRAPREAEDLLASALERILHLANFGELGARASKDLRIFPGASENGPEISILLVFLL